MSSTTRSRRSLTDSVLDERSALNTRASFILGSASILIGAVTGILGVAAGFHPIQRNVVHWGIAIGILIYLVVVYFAWRAYREDSFEVIKPFRLTDYLDYQEYDTKRYMIRTRLDNYLLDRDTLARKMGILSKTWGPGILRPLSRERVTERERVGRS